MKYLKNGFHQNCFSRILLVDFKTLPKNTLFKVALLKGIKNVLF